MNLRVAFGASDPESEAGKTLLDSLGIQWVQTTAGGRPVDGRTAYECDPIAGVTHWFEACPTGAPTGASPQDRPCAVCGDWPARADAGPCIGGGNHAWGMVLDHHRPGDPGEGFGPSEFLCGSSIGQLIAALCELPTLDIPQWPKTESPLRIGWGTEPGLAIFWQQMHVALFAAETTRQVDAGTVLSDDERGMRPVVRNVRNVRHIRVIPKEILLCAAADHCLSAAYRGLCPGVEPEDLMLWRATSRAEFQDRTVEDVLRDIEAATAAIHAAPRLQFADERRTEVADLRGRRVPELPEAQARLGISIICDGIPDRDGRAKLNCMGTHWACSAFLASLHALDCDPSSGYGDPYRGIVGAYRLSKEE